MKSSPPRADYSGTPLARKLGVLSAKSTMRSVALLREPAGFRDMLRLSENWPAGVDFTTRVTAGTQLAVSFVHTLSELEPLAEMLSLQLPPGVSAWICWPKARHKPGFHGDAVRNAGLGHGLVDYKVCSVDEDWSALKFARRKV